MLKLQLIHWNTEEAEERAARLTSYGYEVDFFPLNSNRLQSLFKNPPHAIIIDLSRLPSQGRDLGITLRKRKSTRMVPIIFVDGQEEKVSRVKSLLPDAHFTSWEDIRTAITFVLNHPEENPIIPESTMVAYRGTPLPQKLGIKNGITVGLHGAPTGFIDVLGTLPPQVTLHIQPAYPSDLTLWFVYNYQDLVKDIESMAARVGKEGLWVMWQKNSAKKTGLSQIIVRKAGMAAGLVDYKIASIDEKWSGLRFAVKATP